ncbi:MAG TPA: type II toxin-antitoxin system prevent-host-death family antitoxin [Xanthobacteraceae bacterium]|nr:type II toxin-antitoxin system prevent-host-death family antitoxin [Xanthobacteraceae bacterium]
MEEFISAAEAKRHFSQVLRAVRRGCSYVITRHGRPVAKIIPVGAHDEIMASGRIALIARLRSQPTLDVGPWMRDELYQDRQ